MNSTPDVYVAVIGPGRSAAPEHRAAAARIGALLADAGAILLTGGLGGVMAAAAEGCRAAGGMSVGLLPDRDRTRANPHSTLTVPTGLGELRNGLLVRAAHVVIAVAPSWGTVSEVALAVRTGVPVVTLGDWGLPLAGPIPATTSESAVQQALELVFAERQAPTGPQAPPVHHLTLTVTDVERSARWYQSLLGPATEIRRSARDWERIRLDWPGGLVIGLTAHAATDADDRFDHLRPGLDHVGLACAGEAEVRAWAERLDSIGAPRGPVEDVPYAWAVTGRDPDNIPIEFFAPK
jgi:uncharacterized protein (TIGR00725 family)